MGRPGTSASNVGDLHSFSCDVVLIMYSNLQIPTILDISGYPNHVVKHRRKEPLVFAVTMGFTGLSSDISVIEAAISLMSRFASVLSIWGSESNKCSKSL
jgi:hypothetical protein